ncbi:putative protein-transmembrane prediction [Arcticibacter svalbardensis MN12-7]|uniref:Right handed beta helix domain-containing protein n=1 Tax=Arcticibacter svalbardensis MN12-7 TaxID=1150600 RepID=R9GSF6_9SPHI|nr:hypothetical protein [Arcticibacter svalbardensis]EOR94618.1 putative protein-transmembrane prediction [Arcticibacter svalbardensis MN12-7]
MGKKYLLALSLLAGVAFIVNAKPFTEDVGGLNSSKVKRFKSQNISDSLIVSSIKELASVAANSNQKVKMLPGVYKMEDYLTQKVINNTTADVINRAAMITFSGNNNTYDFTGVTIEVNTKLLNVFGKYVIEFYVTGNKNSLNGLTITDIGDKFPAKGGNSFTVEGTDVKIENVTLNVKGSYPYGYGDLLGKGGGSISSLKKHSGMLISGTNVLIDRCTVISKSFGHLFFVQGGRNVLFKDCYAEAFTRTTDEMLAEKSGPAFDLNFESVYKNYEGKNAITPGYTKSLSECGFRTYGGGGVNKRSTGAVSAISCKAKNTRIGFAFTKVEEEMVIKDSEATGCESGFNITGVNVENSRGDAVNGPLLYINDGATSKAELYLIPNVAITKLHAVACIAGDNHVITIRNWENKPQKQSYPIILGATRSSGSNPFSPIGSGASTHLVLNNYTGLPVEIRPKVNSSSIKTNGAIIGNSAGNTIIKIK